MLKSVMAGAASMIAVVGMAHAADHHKGDKMEKAVMVGGEAMYPSKTIVQNASKAPNLTTLVAAVKAADLVDTLSGDGPFTVFAPTNNAFAEIQGTVDTLLMPENKAALTQVLTYHVVPGKTNAADLITMIENDDDGMVELTTVSGGTLTAMLEGGNVKIRDANGGVATVTTADVNQSNGVVHVVDAVLVPSL